MAHASLRRKDNVVYLAPAPARALVALAPPPAPPMHRRMWRILAILVRFAFLIGLATFLLIGLVAFMMGIYLSSKHR